MNMSFQKKRKHQRLFYRFFNTVKPTFYVTYLFFFEIDRYCYIEGMQMKQGRNSVYLLDNPTELDGLSPTVESHLKVFIERVTDTQSPTPEQASFLVSLHTDSHKEISYSPSVADQQILAWFETFQSTKTYMSAIEITSKIIFFHGVDGILELTCYLETKGAIEAGCQKDPLADDVFLRMRGEYIANLEREIEQSQNDTSASDDRKARRLFDLVAGSAGTYELISIATASENPKLRDDGTLDYAQWRSQLATAVARDREIYNQQVEARLPAAVELSVRQRVLVLADDPAISNQLQFALSHSRMETTFCDDAIHILDTLNRTQPDILVVEQTLEHFDGMDIAAHVRTLDRFVAMPILVLLRDSSEQTITRAIRAGIDSRLSIPFSAANVALSVLNLLNRVEISRKLGGRDNLTGLYTKEALTDRLEQDLLRVARSGQQLAVMLLQLTQTDTPRVDFLSLVDVAKRVFRRSDMLARYNEATLAVVLPGIDGKTVLSISNRFFQVLDSRLSVETAISITDGNANASGLLADVEIRLSRAIGGSRDAALGVYEQSIPPEKANAVPKILIADTDEAIINLLTFFCIREGFEVENVKNGTDLLKYLESSRHDDTLPDLLVLESFLPGVDGFQVLERIQSELAGRISVVMMSVRPSEERVAKAFKLGAIDFVAKPFRVPEMIARIRNGLERSFSI